jgi:hypothetical protein
VQCKTVVVEDVEFVITTFSEQEKQAELRDERQNRLVSCVKSLDAESQSA